MSWSLPRSIIRRIARFQRVVYDDLGTGYEARFRTKDEDFGAPRSVKGIGDLLLTLRFATTSGANLRYQTVFDRGTRTSKVRSLLLTSTTGSLWDSSLWDTAEWASDSDEIETKVYGTGSGRTISHRLSNSNRNEPFFLVELAYQVDLRDAALGRDDAA